MLRPLGGDGGGGVVVVVDGAVGGNGGGGLVGGGVGVVGVVVDGPVAALARVVARSGYLAEGLVQRQVVPDGVLEGS